MKERKIVDNYRDLMVGKYEEILAISKDVALEEIDKQVKILSILTGMTEDELLAIPIAEFERLCKASRFLQDAVDDTHMRVAKTYRCNGLDLIPVTDLQKVTTAQYIDFQSFCNDMNENFVDILSCFLIPKGKTYGHGYEIREVKEAIRENMSVAEAVALYAFFFISFKNLIRSSLTYSMKEAQKIKDKTKRKEMEERILEQMRLLSGNGDGSRM